MGGNFGSSEKWLRRVMGMPEAVRSWRGPLGADQDFQMGTTNVEVKTSTAHGLESIPISSERQLDVPEGVGLILVAMSLDSRMGFGGNASRNGGEFQNSSFRGQLPRSIG